MSYAMVLKEVKGYDGVSRMSCLEGTATVKAQSKAKQATSFCIFPRPCLMLITENLSHEFWLVRFFCLGMFSHQRQLLCAYDFSLSAGFVSVNVV